MNAPTLPRFLVLEGIDGSGTTTQSQHVAERLRARGHRVLETREPSRGRVGMLAREWLAASERVEPHVLALLFAADRLEHLDREIEPALREGTVVLCDRYVVSSWVYQSIDCDPAWIRTINGRARWPDRTFVFSLPAALALERVAARRAATGQIVERFDDDRTQHRLADAYEAVLREAERAPSELPGLVRIDASQPIEAVTDAIVEQCVAAGL